MDRTKQWTLTTILVMFIIALILGVSIAPAGERKVADEDQRPGLVETAVMFEQTDTYYPTGAEYVQAVYASQGIEISTDLGEDSYSAQSGPMVGDIVIGHDYVGIMTGEGVAVGVSNDGGFAQVMRLTTEDIRRVDW